VLTLPETAGDASGCLVPLETNGIDAAGASTLNHSTDTRAYDTPALVFATKQRSDHATDGPEFTGSSPFLISVIRTLTRDATADAPHSPGQHARPSHGTASPGSPTSDNTAVNSVAGSPTSRVFPKHDYVEIEEPLSLGTMPEGSSHQVLQTNPYEVEEEEAMILVKTQIKIVEKPAGVWEWAMEKICKLEERVEKHMKDLQKEEQKAGDTINPVKPRLRRSEANGFESPESDNSSDDDDSDDEVENLGRPLVSAAEVFEGLGKGKHTPPNPSECLDLHVQDKHTSGNARLPPTALSCPSDMSTSPSTCSTGEQLNKSELARPTDGKKETVEEANATWEKIVDSLREEHEEELQDLKKQVEAYKKEGRNNKQRGNALENKLRAANKTIEDLKTKIKGNEIEHSKAIKKATDEKEAKNKSLVNALADADTTISLLDSSLTCRIKDLQRFGEHWEPLVTEHAHYIDRANARFFEVQVAYSDLLAQHQQAERTAAANLQQAMLQNEQNQRYQIQVRRLEQQLRAANSPPIPVNEPATGLDPEKEIEYRERIEFQEESILAYQDRVEELEEQLRTANSRRPHAGTELDPRKEKAYLEHIGKQQDRIEAQWNRVLALEQQLEAAKAETSSDHDDDHAACAVRVMELLERLQDAETKLADSGTGGVA